MFSNVSGTRKTEQNDSQKKKKKKTKQNENYFKLTKKV